MKVDRLGVNRKLLAVFTAATVSFGGAAFFLKGNLDYSFEGEDVTYTEEDGTYIVSLSNGDGYEISKEQLQEEFEDKKLEMGFNSYELDEGEICTVKVSEDYDLKTGMTIGSFIIMFISGMKIFSNCLYDNDERKYRVRTRS